MSCFLAKFCVFFSSTCAFSNFPTVVQVDGKPFLRSTTGLCFISTHGKKENMKLEHMLWRKLEVCLFLLDRLIGLGFG